MLLVPTAEKETMTAQRKKKTLISIQANVASIVVRVLLAIVLGRDFWGEYRPVHK